MGPDSEAEELQQHYHSHNRPHEHTHSHFHPHNLPHAQSLATNAAHSNASSLELPKAVEKRHLSDPATVTDKPLYASRQAPRRVRLQREKEQLAPLDRAIDEPSRDHLKPSIEPEALDETVDLHTNLKRLSASPLLSATIPVKTRRRSSLIHADPIELPKLLKASRPPLSPTGLSHPNAASNLRRQAAGALPSLQVMCHARTRVPTPHGEVFLHLYRNNHDDKEHLAFVFDRQQLEQPVQAESSQEEQGVYGMLRSKSLDSSWREGETDMERIVRGAYVGRLSGSSAVPSSSDPSAIVVPSGSSQSRARESRTQAEPVLIRIHSECFTGETIGSQRCDCGEQLDEAFRLIASSPSGLGVIVYLRQEGRGIGLLEKIKAYNLQDLGHDTVTANLLLGHSADMRTYGIAGEMLRDLGVDAVRLLTNNPDKVESVEKEGIKVVERVPMVPRGWAVSHTSQPRSSKKKTTQKGAHSAKQRRRAGKNLMSSIMAMSGPASEAPPGIDVDAEAADGGDEAGSYPFPSAPGSPLPTSDRDSDTSDSTDSQAQDDYLIAMNRTGVGMIGAGTTHSVELEKYLKTKIERMGHLLAVPSAPPSTPEPRLRQKRRKEKKSSAIAACAPELEESQTLHRDRGMEESVTSLYQTDPESVKCGEEDCAECGFGM